MIKNKIESENKVYDLCYDVSRIDDTRYTISVSKVYEGDIIDVSVVEFASITFDNLVEIAEVMCRNTVTPSSFNELVKDMIVDKIVVEKRHC